MRFKYTMLFQARTNVGGTANDAHIGGWSESIYGAEGAFAISTVVFNRLMVARAQLLPSSTAIIGQRYQAVDPVGASSTGATRLPGTWASDTDIPQMAVLLRGKAQGQPNVSRVTLRGVPDELVFQGEFKNKDNYQALLNAYLGELNNWFFKARDLAAEQARILDIDANGNVVTLDAITAPVETLVRVLRTVEEDGTFVGGLFKIQTKTDNFNFKLREWEGQVTRKGRIRVETVTYPRFGNFGTTGNPFPTPRVLTRKVGRPFGQYRGRASRRR